MNIKQLNEELDKLLEFTDGLFDNNKKNSLENAVEKIIKDNNLYYYIYPCNDERIAVEVDGDWKHDHAYFDNLMRSHGFILDDKILVGEETGDDSYTAIHYYKEI